MNADSADPCPMFISQTGGIPQVTELSLELK